VHIYLQFCESHAYQASDMPCVTESNTIYSFVTRLCSLTNYTIRAFRLLVQLEAAGMMYYNNSMMVARSLELAVASILTLMLLAVTVILWLGQQTSAT
jgi:hypothetical protein